MGVELVKRPELGRSNLSTEDWAVDEGKIIVGKAATERNRGPINLREIEHVLNSEGRI
jgi:hypothetical protein